MLGKIETISSVKQITDITKSFQISSIEDVYPLGFVYVQYPQKKSPSELFPSLSWQEIDYSGAFFRASGINAAPFITASGTLVTQPQGTSTTSLGITKAGSVYGNSQDLYDSYWELKHSHQAYAGNYYEAGSYYSYGAAGFSYGSFNDHWHVGYTSAGDPGNPAGDAQNMYHRHSYTFTPSVSNDLSFAWSSDDSETRPTNYTIKLWKRT